MIPDNNIDIMKQLSKDPVKEIVVEEYDELSKENLLRKKKKIFNPYKDNINEADSNLKMTNFAGDEV